jgi:hypothetical protein
VAVSREATLSTLRGDIARDNGDIELRLTFVEMLFALAVSQIAIAAADLVSIDDSFPRKLPAVTHLVVALAVISASWLGWKRSVSPGSREPMRHLFSLPFLAMIIDVCLVILYFIIVRTVEIEQSGGVTRLASPSASPESFWLLCVFIVYAGWDVVTDILAPGCIPQGTGASTLMNYLWRLGKLMAALAVSTSASVLSALLTLVALFLANARSSPMQVALIDVALVCVVLLFRLFKAAETSLARTLKITDCKAFATPRPTQGNEWRWGIALGFAYVVCLVVALGGVHR